MDARRHGYVLEDETNDIVVFFSLFFFGGGFSLWNIYIYISPAPSLYLYLSCPTFFPVKFLLPINNHTWHTTYAYVLLTHIPLHLNFFSPLDIFWKLARIGKILFWFAFVGVSVGVEGYCGGKGRVVTLSYYVRVKQKLTPSLHLFLSFIFNRIYACGCVRACCWQGIELVHMLPCVAHACRLAFSFCSKTEEKKKERNQCRPTNACAHTLWIVKVR